MSRALPGRILRGERAAQATTLAVPERFASIAASRLSAVEAAAFARAEAILHSAEQRAEELVFAARQRAHEVELEAQARARADALATVSHALVRAAEREAAADEDALERAITLAQLIAERLLGGALALSPERTTELARSALEEAAGARRVTIEAHPADVATLATALSDRAGGKTIAVVENADLGRGDLRVVSESGTIDARLGERVARLAERLKESLGT